MIRSRQRYTLLCAIMALALLAACSSSAETAPQLLAPPTRTAQPATTTPTADELLANVQFVSMRASIATYLDDAAAANPLDRSFVFEKDVLDPAPECGQATYFRGVIPLELFNFDFVTTDLDVWRASVDAFPEDALIARIRSTLTDAFGLLPPAGPLTICMLPAPRFRRGEQDNQPLPDGGLMVNVLADNLLVVSCADGDTCLDAVPRLVAYNYHYAYQIGQAGLAYPDVPLLNFMLYAARAADFARQLDPTLAEPWDNALTPAQESAEWATMQDYLELTYSDGITGRKIDSFMNGKTNSTDYPLWGGHFIGAQIVRAYRAAHPSVSVAQLAALPPATVLQDSGYAPG